MIEGETMIFALILGGGQGTRMGNTDKPKQLLTIGEKPIIIHTIEKFYINNDIDYVVTLCPKQWVSHIRELIQKYLPDSCNIAVVEGGDTRNETIINGIKFIEQEFGTDNETGIITHDAVRPFVTHRIIEENIKALRDGVSSNTVVPASDTIVESIDGKYITSIPNRANYYMGQTPQSFNARKYMDYYEMLSEEEKNKLTDAAKVFVLRSDKVRLIDGEPFNIKITYPYDLQLAETLLRG